MKKIKDIATLHGATVVDTVSGLAFEIDYAYEKNGELFYHVASEGDGYTAGDGFDIKDNAEFTLIEKTDIFKNGQVESWLKSGDSNKVVEAIASKIYSVDKTDDKFRLSNVYETTYTNAEGQQVDIRIGERYAAFKNDIAKMDARLKNTFGEKGLGKKECVEARIAGIERLFAKHDIGRDIAVYKNYQELHSYEAAVDKTNSDIHEKRSMSAVARAELKIDSIKTEMAAYKTRNIGKGFAHLGLGAVFFAVPIINVFLIGSGLKNILFKTYASKMEKDYYKELKSELKSAERQLEAAQTMRAEALEYMNDILKIDKDLDRQENRLNEVNEKLQDPNLSEKEKAKLEKKADKISKEIEKLEAKREAKEIEVEKLGYKADERTSKLETPQEKVEDNKEKTEEKDKDTSEKKEDSKDEKKDEDKDESKSDEKSEEEKEDSETESKEDKSEKIDEEKTEDSDKETEKETEPSLSKEELEDKIKDAKEKVAELEQYKENKENKLAYTKADLDKETDPDKRVKLERKVSNIENDIKGADEKLAGYNERIADYQNQLDKLDKNEVNQEPETENSNEPKDDKVEVKDAKDLEIEKLKAENDVLKAENANLKADAESLKAELEALKNEIGELKEKVENLENSKDKTENNESFEEKEDLTDKVNSLEQENETLKSELSEKDDKINELEEKLESLEKDREPIETQEEQQLEETKETETQVEETVDDVETKEEVSEAMPKAEKVDLKVATAEYREEAFARRISEAAIDSKSNETIVVNEIENGKLSFDIISKDPVEAENGSMKSIEISSSDATRPDKLDTISSNGVELTFSKDIINNRIGYKEDSIKDMIGKGIASKEDNQLMEVKVNNPDGTVEVFDKNNNELPQEVKNEIIDLIGQEAFDKVADTFEAGAEVIEDAHEQIEDQEKTDADNLDEETYDSNEISEDVADNQLGELLENTDAVDIPDFGNDNWEEPESYDEISDDMNAVNDGLEDLEDTSNDYDDYDSYDGDSAE